MKTAKFRLLQYSVCLGLLLLFGTFAGSADEQDGDTKIAIRNDYLQVEVHKEIARYQIRTIEGNPASSNDNDVCLLYDHDPPTSFTTITLDDGDDVYVYGSDDGEFVKRPHVKDGSIVTVWAVDDCEITQTLSFVRSPGDSQRKDSVQIAYRVVNKSDDNKKPGIRILIDTALGEEDGTPYFVPGYGTVDDEKEFPGNKVPQYWYSFDDLDEPNIRSMGTVRGPGTVLPDRLIFASWKKLSEKKWEFETDEGDSFKRSWLGSRDSAVALYYDTRTLGPGAKHEVSTLYGMYATERMKGDVWSLKLGGSQIIYFKNPFVITADIQNISDKEMENCRVKLSFSSNIANPITNEEGDYVPLDMEIDDLDPQEQRNFSWPFITRDGIEGAYWCHMEVRGEYEGKTYNEKMKRRIYINRVSDRKVTIGRPSTNDNNEGDEAIVPTEKPAAKRIPFPDLEKLNRLIARLNTSSSRTAKKIARINAELEKIRKRMSSASYSTEEFERDYKRISELLGQLEILEQELEQEIRKDLQRGKDGGSKGSSESNESDESKESGETSDSGKSASDSRDESDRR